MGIYNINGEELIDQIQYPYVKSFTPLLYHHNLTEDLGQWINHNTYHEMMIMAHISDLHNDPIRYSRFLNFVGQNASDIDVAVESGDLIDIPSDSAYAEMVSVETKYNVPVLKCVGNHERVFSDTSISNTAVYQKLGLSTNTGKTWYYNDYLKYKIRVIVVNCYESESVGDKKYYSITQLNWLISTLKEAYTLGYSVIIVLHSVDGARTIKNNKGFFIRGCQFEDPQYPDPMSVQTPLEDIVAAFRTGSSIQKTYHWDDSRGSDITLNDSFSGNGKFVCYLHGHYHQDMIGYSPKHEDQLYLGIATGCLKSTTRPNIVWEETSDLPRAEGEVSEDLFNLYCIDTKNKFVKVLRVGSNINDILEPRVSAVFDYEPSLI